MGAYRNTALYQEPHDVGGPTTTLELDHVGTGLHQHRRTAKRLLFGFLVGAKGQVSDHPSRTLGAADTARHALGVVAHIVQGHTDRAVQALAHHAQ